MSGEVLVRLLAKEREKNAAKGADAETTAWTAVGRVLLNLDETITRE